MSVLPVSTQIEVGLTNSRSSRDACRGLAAPAELSFLAANSSASSLARITLSRLSAISERSLCVPSTPDPSGDGHAPSLFSRRQGRVPLRDLCAIPSYFVGNFFRLVSLRKCARAT